MLAHNMEFGVLKNLWFLTAAEGAHSYLNVYEKHNYLQHPLSSMNNFIKGCGFLKGMIKAYIHPTADVSKHAKIGVNTKIWHQCQVRENASIGNNCTLGKNVYIDHDIVIGDNVKIQNNASIYFAAAINDGAFIGPHACLINDKSPRAVTPEGKLKRNQDWRTGKIVVGKGASVGAGSIILPDLKIGSFALIGAGSVVTKDVPDYGLMYGNPAKLMGYACKCGAKITRVEEKGKKLILYCLKCKEKLVASK